MVTVETFVEFMRKKDVGRIRFAIRETLYDLGATDEVRTRNVTTRICTKISCEVIIFSRVFVFSYSYRLVD